jgi:polar amino acid transport system substrate-binding protein
MQFRPLLGVALAVATLGLAMPGAALAEGKAWKASIAQMPNGISESKDKGILIDLVKAMARVSGDSVEIEVVPFPRSMANAIERKADFHLPMLQPDPAQTSTDKFDFSTELVYNVNFVLYTRKGTGITPENAAKFKIETDTAHTAMFGIPTVATSNLEAAIKRVDAGRSDGLIFVDSVIDPIVKANQLSNVQRSLFKVIGMRFVLPQGERGKETDKYLTSALKKLKASGEMNKLVGIAMRPYDNWQP